VHLQIRSKATKSPPDLRAFLEVLAEAEINIVAAGGSNVEQDGEFAFAVDHDMEEQAVAVLEQAGYQPRIVEVGTWFIDNSPGQLLGCVTEASEANQLTGRVIKDLSVGMPDADGRIPVQIYSELPLEVIDPEG